MFEPLTIKARVPSPRIDVVHDAILAHSGSAGGRPPRVSKAAAPLRDPRERCPVGFSAAYATQGTKGLEVADGDFSQCTIRGSGHASPGVDPGQRTAVVHSHRIASGTKELIPPIIKQVEESCQASDLFRGRYSTGF